MATTKKRKAMGVTATLELCNMIKADLAKKQDIIQFVEMPCYVEYTGRIIQYVGESTPKLIRGHFYHSNGFAWNEVYDGEGGGTQIVDILPPASAAEYNKIYLTVNEHNEVKAFLKKDENSYYPLTVDSNFLVVANLPSWEDAREDRMYFIVDGDKVSMYLKNPDVVDAFFELTGGGASNFNELENTPTINGISLKNEDDPEVAKNIQLNAKVQKHNADDSYPDEPTEFPVNELFLKALTFDELDAIIEEARGE